MTLWLGLFTLRQEGGGSQGGGGGSGHTPVYRVGDGGLREVERREVRYRPFAWDS